MMVLSSGMVIKGCAIRRQGDTSTLQQDRQRHPVC